MNVNDWTARSRLNIIIRVILAKDPSVSVTGNEFSFCVRQVAYTGTQTHYITNVGRMTVVEGDSFLIKKGSFGWPVKRD
jgi:hypothetical protein